MIIKFLPLETKHFDLLLKWLEMPHVKKWWDQDISYTKEIVKDKYGSYIKGYKLIAGNQKSIASFIIEIDQKPVGYIQIYNADDSFAKKLPLMPSKNVGALDIFIGEEQYLKKNLGAELISKFLKLYGKRYNYIFVDPDIDNIGAIKCYQNVGFRKIFNNPENGLIYMLWKKEANWELYSRFEEVVYKGKDNEIKDVLRCFDVYDFLEIPIVFDLVNYKKIKLLKLLHDKKIPLNYEQQCGANGLHIACGAGGSLECAKFFIENNIFVDINKKSLKYGDTPLTLAISYEHNDIIEYFKNKFVINSISFNDLEIILERVKINYKKYYNASKNKK